MTRSSAGLAFLLLLLAPIALAGCAGRELVLSSGELIAAPAAAAPGAPAVAVLPFEDARAEFHDPSILAGVPLAGVLAFLDPTVTSHPERRVSPVLDEPLAVFLPRALAASAGPGVEARYFPARPGEEVPIAFDYVVRGRITGVEARVAELDHGLNFFGIVDVSGLPKALGAPSRSLMGKVAFEVEVAERFSGRMVHRQAFLWESGPIREGLYTRREGGVVRRFHAAMATEGAGKAAGEVVKKITEKGL